MHNLSGRARHKRLLDHQVDILEQAESIVADDLENEVEKMFDRLMDAYREAYYRGERESANDVMFHGLTCFPDRWDDDSIVKASKWLEEAEKLLEHD